MSEYHHEISAYVGCSDTQRIVASLVALCERAGMRRIAPVALPALNQSPSKNNYWSVAVLPGAPGWSLLLTLPWAVLCERLPGGGPSRFVALCNALQAPGMLREVHGGIGGYAYGTVMLEADGQGREAISGSMWRHEQAEQLEEMLTWHDQKIAEADREVERPRLIESVMPSDWTLDVEALRSNVEEARLCGEYAQRLGGATGKWWQPESAWARLEAAIELGGPLPVPGGVLLTFEWPAQDRPAPRPSRYALALQAFNKEPRFFYADGAKICVGDQVELEDGLRAIVTGLCTKNNGQGVPEPGDALLETLGGRHWMVPLKSLRFLARPEPFRPTLDRPTLERAAEQGDAAAQYELGMMYAAGIAVSRNHFTAALWFHQAAEHGHRDAQYEFAERLLNGNGVLPDREQARKWFIQAGLQGHIGAQLRLVRLYENEFNYPQDPVEAARWLAKAASSGDESARYTLAWKFEHGRGLAQDYEQAALWYLKSAEQGHTGAQVNLANLYRSGRGVPQSHQQALEWYSRAAARGNRVAQYNLGTMYKNGEGVAPSREQATTWLRKSADNGFADAKAALQALARIASSQQALRLDIDIRTRVAHLSVGEWADLQIPAPSWLSNDALVRAFNAYPTLLQEGKLAWAHIIQANHNLFKSGEGDCPAEVVFDPKGALGPLELAPVAQQLAALRARLPTLSESDPAERPLWEIASHLEAETTRVFGLGTPAQISDRGLRISSLYIHRRHLPQGFLQQSYFPILMSEKCFGAVMLLPSRWWPRELLALWRQEKDVDRTEVGDKDGSGPRHANGASKPDYRPPIQQYREGAMQGQADAQFNLGVLYAGGDGVERDDTKAAEWYRSAALQGHAKAQLALGIMHETGRGVVQDYRQAADWYRKAGLQGDAGAQSVLGHSYEMGRGVAQNREQAGEWYGKAAAQAQAIAFTRYSRAASRGHANAQLQLGILYKYGEGVKKDNQKAFEWWLMAAMQGIAQAQYNVGSCYGSGIGVPADHKQAAEWHRKAADQGHAMSQLNLAASYLTGVGLPKDLRLAYFWLLLSAAQGSQTAIKHRDSVAKHLSEQQRADTQAAAEAWRPKNA
jgi:TPR repeat protein